MGIGAGILLISLGGIHCPWPPNSDQPWPFSKPKSPSQTPAPEKVALPGMIPETEDLSGKIIACSGRLQLDKLQRSPADRPANRTRMEVSASGNFQDTANLIACFGKGPVIWELGDVRLLHGAPRLGDYRVNLAVTAYHSLLVPGPGFSSRAEAEAWFAGLPAQCQDTAALLSAIYLGAEPAIELRKIELGQKEGRIEGRAGRYEEIYALMEGLKNKGLVKNPRLEQLRRHQAGLGEQDQEFEMRFER